ncbi:MAG: CHASE2 domain-containing protein [Candidatus Eremiobacteraeota bacterium]|nr:CHASE2 domain-containing protein [Candidatus Eremiobacteraeota bacterium]MBV8366303.1 CHASE2 domain-containing protein [Candidatus Eremiobacteraeota bacterium]
MIGTAISLLLAPIETNVFVSELRDKMLTWQVSQFAGTDIGANLAFIDIDDQTHVTAWGSPYYTPRDKLCRLIDYAVRAPASVVVVDIDLSAASAVQRRALTCDSATDQHAIDKLASTPDQALADYLRGYDARCPRSGARSGCPSIILTRGLRTSAHDLLSNGAPAHEPRPSFLEPIGRDSNSIAFGTAVFHVDADGLVRGWRLWEPVCEQLHGQALASAELLAVAAYNGKDILKLQRALDVGLEPECQPAPGHAANAPANAQRASAAQMPRDRYVVDIGYPLELSTSDLERRFFYRFGWSQPGSSRRKGQRLAVVVPAWEITDVAPTQRFDPSLLRGKIVVIGGTYADDPDVHQTPLGEMPGTVVLLNAINALLHDDHIREAPWYLRYGIDAFLTILVSMMYFYLPHRAAMWSASVLIVVLAVTGGYVLLDRGFYFDPILPILGIQVHEFIGGMESWLRRRRTVT